VSDQGEWSNLRSFCTWKGHCSLSKAKIKMRCTSLFCTDGPSSWTHMPWNINRFPPKSYHVPLLLEKGLGSTSLLLVYNDRVNIHCTAVCKIQCHLWRRSTTPLVTAPYRCSWVSFHISLLVGQYIDLKHTQSLCLCLSLTSMTMKLCPSQRRMVSFVLLEKRVPFYWTPPISFS
jgi:hypothetical protein